MQRPALKLLLACALPLTAMATKTSPSLPASVASKLEPYPTSIVENALFLKQMCQCSDLRIYMAINSFHAERPLTEDEFLEKALPLYYTPAGWQNLQEYYYEVMVLGRYLEKCLGEGAYHLSQTDKDNLTLYRDAVQKRHIHLVETKGFNVEWFEPKFSVWTKAGVVIAAVLGRQGAPNVYKTVTDAKYALSQAGKESDLDSLASEENAAYVAQILGGPPPESIPPSSSSAYSLFIKAATLYLQQERTREDQIIKACLMGMNSYGAHLGEVNREITQHEQDLSQIVRSLKATCGIPPHWTSSRKHSR